MIIPIWGGAYDAVLRKNNFDETEHPRVPAGGENGGQFAPKNGVTVVTHPTIAPSSLDVPFGKPTNITTPYGATVYELSIRDQENYDRDVLGHLVNEKRIRELEEKIGNGEAVPHTYMARRPDGFLESYDVEPLTQWDGEKARLVGWHVRTNGYGDLFFKNIRVYLHGEPKRPSQDKAYAEQFYTGTPEDALRQGLEWERVHQSELEKRFTKTAERKDPLWSMLGDYRYHPNKMGAGKIIRKVRTDAFANYHAQRTLDKLPFDVDGYITLYRGGHPNGVSWSQSQKVAERFSRYEDFGTVDARASALIAIQSIRNGALTKPVTIQERRFHRSQLIAAIDGSEKEVLVDPAVFNATG